MLLKDIVEYGKYFYCVNKCDKYRVVRNKSHPEKPAKLKTKTRDNIMKTHLQATKLHQLSLP